MFYHEGKTTTSCSLAIQLSKVRKSVLLIVCSVLAIPHMLRLTWTSSLLIRHTTCRMLLARNLARMQPRLTASKISTLWRSIRRVQFKKWSKIVRRRSNFVPLAPHIYFTSADQNGMMGSMMQDLAFAIPGVDEAMGFAEIMKYVNFSDIAGTSADSVL